MNDPHELGHGSGEKKLKQNSSHMLSTSKSERNTSLICLSNHVTVWNIEQHVNEETKAPERSLQQLAHRSITHEPGSLVYIPVRVHVLVMYSRHMLLVT